MSYISIYGRTPALGASFMLGGIWRMLRGQPGLVEQPVGLRQGAEAQLVHGEPRSKLTSTTKTTQKAAENKPKAAFFIIFL